MNSASKSMKKTPRHAISGLLGQPTPGTSSSRLSKSFNNRDDLLRKTTHKKLLRHRRSLGSEDFNNPAGLNYTELEEDTETPRAHIEAFLQHADTDKTTERSTRRTPGRPDARSFTRTPSKLTRNPQMTAVRAEASSASIPSPTSAFTPRTNIERLLQGEGSEHVPKTHSLMHQQVKSESKIFPGRRSRKWDQRVSASPLYLSQVGDEGDESDVSAGGNFRSLKKRRSFHIPDPGIASQPTPVSKRPNDSRLSKSESKILSGVRKASWAQRASTSPLNHSDFARRNAEDSGASPGRFFQYQRQRRSFHIPDPPKLSISREFAEDKSFKNNVMEPSPKDDYLDEQDDGDEELVNRNQASRGKRETLLESSTHHLGSSGISQEEMKDRMRVYDLSDGSSDLDFTPSENSNKDQSSKQVSASRSQQLRSSNKTPLVRQNSDFSSRPTPKSSSGKRKMSSGEFSTPRTGRKSSRLNSHSRDSARLSKRGRLDLDGNKANNSSTVSLALSPELVGIKSSPDEVFHPPSAPSSSTPRKRHKPSTSVHAADNFSGGDLTSSRSSRRLSNSNFQTPTTSGTNRRASRLSSHTRNSEGREQGDLDYVDDRTNQHPLMLSPTPSPQLLGDGIKRTPSEGIHPLSAPPSSTPLRRHKSSVSINAVDISGQTLSRLRQRSAEVVSVVANTTLPGLSPIRADDGYNDGDDKAGDDDAPSTSLSLPINGGLIPQETEQKSPEEMVEHENIPEKQQAGGSPHLNEEPEDNEMLENDSSGNLSVVETPKIDMSKKPPSLSTKKLHLLTPQREEGDRGNLQHRGNKKVAPHRATGKAGKSSSRDLSFVTRKMVKFYAERFSTMSMDKEVIDELMKASNKLWTQNLKAAEGYARHAGRKTTTEADVVLLMKIQRMVSSTEELRDLIREFLPMELRCQLIPTAHAHFPGQ